MRLYAAKGDRSQALRQYQLCRDHLQRDLGVKPEAGDGAPARGDQVARRAHRAAIGAGESAGDAAAAGPPLSAGRPG